MGREAVVGHWPCRRGQECEHLQQGGSEGFGQRHDVI